MQIDPNSAQADMLAGQALDGLYKTDEADSAVQAQRQRPLLTNRMCISDWVTCSGSSHNMTMRTGFKLELANDPNHAQPCAYLGDTLVNRGMKPKLRHAGACREAAGAARQGVFGSRHFVCDRKQNAEALLSTACSCHGPEGSDGHIGWRLYQAMASRQEAKVELPKAEIHQTKDEGLVRQMTGSPAGLSKPWMV